MKIGILGGTFDPIHNAHLHLADAARKQFHLDKVVFMPALIPPHKSHQRHLTPAPYRYHMVELALKSHPEFEISDLEFSRPEVSFTVDTLRSLKQKHPQDIFYLIMGADSAADFSKWHQPEEIVKLAKLLIAKRPGSDASKISFPFEWIEMPEDDLAATHLRYRFEKGENLPEGAIPKEVQNYIQKMNLYRKAVRGGNS